MSFARQGLYRCSRVAGVAACLVGIVFGGTYAIAEPTDAKPPTATPPEKAASAAPATPVAAEAAPVPDPAPNGTPPTKDSQPAPVPASSAEPAAAATTPADGRLTFNFRYQPWQSVLDWFAEQADLSLLMESPPPGTFNYSDSRSYTAAQALDVLNGVLLTKGYTLVRHGKMLVVVNLEDGIPPNLVPDVPLEELDERGEYELIRVLFPVWNMTPEQASTEVQPLLGPQGKVVVLPQARQIQVTETGGRLRTIRSVINAVEQPEMGAAGVREFALKYIALDSAMPTIRQILGIPAEAYSSPDNTVQITKSALGDKLIFRGTAQQAARLSAVLKLIDVAEASRGVNGSPQLEIYSITNADPEAVVKMLQMMLRNDPSVILSADKDAGHVIAFATPPQQASIKATVDQLQKEVKQVDVISLSNVDPQVAVLAINKLFGSEGKEPDPKAPRVDADITTRSLMVRGSAAQVAQIRDLLRKLGETEDEGGTASNKQHVRLLPLTGAAARSAVSQIEQIWPTLRQNRIRIVSPSSGIPSYRPGDSPQNSTNSSPGPSASAPRNNSQDQMQELWQSFLRDRIAPAPQQPPVSPDSDGAEHKDGERTETGKSNTTADTPNRTVFHLIAGDVSAPPTSSSAIAPGDPAAVPEKSAGPTSNAGTASSSRPGAPIVVAPGPGGTLIASDDLEALDELEELLSTVAGHNATSGREFAVYYLKYSKAPMVAEVLGAIFGGTAAGKDRGIIGDMANNALGGLGGGLMGDLLLGGGGTGGGFTSGTVDIVPDARLNALIVHAKPADLDTVEQLLKVLDQRSGPEDVEAEAQPRSIQVFNATASEIAQIVQQVYQDRMAGAAAVMSPQDMMKMIRGGNNPEQQIQKMSIAIDTRNNMLIVRAPDPLFNEVKALVAELDQAVGDSPETTRVVTLKHTNSAAVQKALTSVLSNVKTSVTSAQTPPPAATTSNNNDENSPEERMRRAVRRNFEMMQEFRRMQESAGGGDRGGGDRSRFFRGGGPGGGGGPGRPDFGGFRGRGGDRGGDGGGGGGRE